MGEGEFDLLATLRRSGEPFELTPGELASSTLVSSGAVTKRVDRCLGKGWVTRRVSDKDGRGRVIALTQAGRALIDEAFTVATRPPARDLGARARGVRDSHA